MCCPLALVRLPRLSASGSYSLEQEHLTSGYTTEENYTLSQQHHLPIFPQVGTGPHGPISTHDEMLKTGSYMSVVQIYREFRRTAAVSRKYLFAAHPPTPWLLGSFCSLFYDILRGWEECHSSPKAIYLIHLDFSTLVVSQS